MSSHEQTVAALKGYAEALSSTAEGIDAQPAVQRALVVEPSPWVLGTFLPVLARRAAAAGTVVALAASGVAVASDGALPGEMLYRADRAVERAGAALGLISAEAIVLERLQEVEALLQAERGDRALEAIRDALLEMQREAPEAAENLEWLIAELEVRLERSVEPDPGLETERPGLGEWLASTLKEGQSLDELRRRLASLPSRYPDEAKVERAEVIRLLEDIPDLLEQGYTLPEILERLDRSGSNVPFEK